jgi:hypothetical protein
MSVIVRGRKKQQEAVRNYTTWTPEKDKVMLDCLLDIRRQNGGSGNGFRQPAYNQVIKLLHTFFHEQIETKQITSRLRLVIL